MIVKLQTIIASTSKIIISKNLRFFAKEAKEVSKKDGKKDEAKGDAQTVALIQQPALLQQAMKWIKPTHSSLSPSELKYYNQGFNDLSQMDKQILNDLAQKLLQTPSAIFYNAVLKKGSLGTSQLYYTNVDISEADVKTKVQGIRKEL